jgi:hypothetical protein
LTICEEPFLLLQKNYEVEANFTIFYEAELLNLEVFDRNCEVGANFTIFYESEWPNLEVFERQF